MKHLLDFLENSARQYGFAYGVQSIPQVAARLETADDPADHPADHPPGDRLIQKVLTAAEKIQFQKFIVQKRRVEWLAGRLAARQAFNRWKERQAWRRDTPQSISILNRPNRAPYIPEHPDLALSISHSHDYAVAVIAQYPIGIDLEKVEARHPALVDYFFSPAEQEWLAGLACPVRHEANPLQHISDQWVTWLWTRKEALAKYLQLGGNLAFKQINAVPDEINLLGVNPTPVRLVSNIKAQGETKPSYCISLAIPAGYAGRHGEPVL